MTQNEVYQQLAEEYRRAGQPWPATKQDIAAWAFSNRHWEMDAETAIAYLANLIGKALREEYIIDDQGRRVRSKHAATIINDDGQLTLWDDIRTASEEFMAIAFQQRRRGIVADCKQIKTDVDSYNDNNTHGGHFQLSLDFRRDVEEQEIDV